MYNGQLECGLWKLLNEFCSVNYQIFKNTYWTHIEYNYTLKSKSENSRYAFVAVGYLDSFSCVSSISILSMTAGSGRPSTGSREKLFPTVMRPRSASTALLDVEDWGIMIRGAFSLMSMASLKLFWAKSLTLEAAFSAAWAVAALRASLAVWKLLLKFCGEKR